MLPVSLTGDPTTTKSHLDSVFRNASIVTIYVELREPKVTILASALWGMAPLVRGDYPVYLVVSAPNAAEIAPRLLDDWQQNSWDPFLQRLGILSNLLEAGRLQIVASMSSTPESLYPLLGLEPSARVAQDHRGNRIAANVSFDELGDSAPPQLQFRWSFGDPARTVDNAWRELETLIARKDGICPVLDQTIRELIGRTAAVPNDWDEPENLPSLASNPVQLFKHQRNAIDAWFAAGHRGIFQMCTGAGKTIASITAAKEYFAQLDENAPAPTVLVTVPTRILADQWRSELSRLGLPKILPCYESAAQWIDLAEAWMQVSTATEPRVLVTTYHTLADNRFIERLRRGYAGGASLFWIADEMHNLGSPRLLGIMDQLLPWSPCRLGLSATPEIEHDYSATERLITGFNRIVATYELKDGIADKVLCPYRYYPRPAYLSPELGDRYLVLLDELNTGSGNSAERINLFRESRELIRTSGVQIDAFAALLNELVGAGQSLSHTLIYCPPGYANRESSDEVDDSEGERLIEQVIELLRNRGISVSSILGGTSNDDRTTILQRFGAGEVQVLCAIGCLDEGVDVPSIKRAIVLYSVDRRKQFIQRRGRILRVPKGVRDKVAEIYDIVVLPHGSTLPEGQAAELLNRELRRYREFADLSVNQIEAKHTIEQALLVATQHEATR